MSTPSPPPTVTTSLPPVIKAGEPVSYTVTIRPDRTLPAGAAITLQRNWPADWGHAQWSDSAAPNHVSTDIAGTWSAGIAGDLHPYDHALTLTLAAPLAEGQAVMIAFNHIAAQTFIEDACRMLVLTRDHPDDPWRQLGEVTTNVVGSAPARLVATAPSHGRPGVPFRVHVRIEDMWGNPASGVDTNVHVQRASDTTRITSEAGSFAWADVTLDAVGVHRLRAEAPALGFSAVANPLRCTDAPGDGPYWGDIHGQSSVGCGAQSVARYFSFARDFAAADFASDQANCYMVSNAAWAETQDAAAGMNAPGRYVPLLGYEWSGTSDLGGDHNVYFPGDTGAIRRCGHFLLDDTSDADTDLPHITDLHDHVRGKDMLLQVHVGGRTTNLEWHEPTTERLLEVHSTHATSEWFLIEALRRGYRLGVTGGSDGVDGRPGASRPGRMSVRNVRGGLAAVRMESLSRENLWAALKARHCYGTTGERILLDFAAGAARYGDDASGRPSFAISVEGTGPLRSMEVFRGTEAVFAAPIAARDATPSDTIRIRWRGASAPGNWRRARMAWDGHVALAGGRIRAARDAIRDTPAEGIIAQTDARVTFASITAGNWNAIDLDIEGDDDLTFATDPMTVTIALADLAAGPVERRADDPMRIVRFERLPREPAAPGWSGTFTDPAPLPGENPYWLRVEQEDGAMAWSSPIFLTSEG